MLDYRMRIQYLLIALSFMTYGLLFQVKPILAQSTTTGCISSGGVCAQVYNTLWEFDKVRQICYQPFAQCGGTQFQTQADCERSCLAQTLISPTAPIVQVTPTATVTPILGTTVIPTGGQIITPAPTAATTPAVSINPTTDPTCKNRDGDANDDKQTTIVDFEIFRQEFGGEVKTLNADFNCDKAVTLSDFEQFRKVFSGEIF